MNQIFDTRTSFEMLGLRRSVLKGLNEAEYLQPTSIQSVAIPLVLEGRDILIHARPGMGKTAAYALPILHLADKDGGNQVLILRPHDDLAVQSTGELRQLGQFTPIRSRYQLTSGESLQSHHSKSTRQEAHILVSTPGVIWERINRKQINITETVCVVLDGLDRMLELGFNGDISRILSSFELNHQIIIVTATVNDEVELIVNEFMSHEPEWAEPHSESLIVALLEQKCFLIQPHHKQQAMLNLLRSIPTSESVVIFCGSKAEQNKVSQFLEANEVRLKDTGPSCRNSPSDRSRDRRGNDRARVTVLSGSDPHGVSMRGVCHLINYDLPEDPEIYVHRAGRIARADKLTTVWSLLDPHKEDLLDTLESYMHITIERAEHPGGMEIATGDEPDQQEVIQVQQEKGKYAISSILSRVMRVDVNMLSDEQRKDMFPDGILPKSVPLATLADRFRRRGR